MRVVVEQPTYLSWAGYFGMMDIADTFVFYDDVQFDRQSWQQRNRIKSPQDEMMWLTVPIFRDFGQNINEVKINNTLNWRKKHWETIKQAYSKSKYYNDYKDEVAEIYERDWDYLCELDMYIILKFAKLFGIKMPEIVKSSNIQGLVGHKTDRLVILLNKLKADEYITSYGTKDYIEADKFRANNIKLSWYEYRPSTYPQIHGEFVPYLSAIDLLFNAGRDAIFFIRKGVNLE
jgi:hypothetical protein